MLKRARIAQDAHSASEQVVYQALWSRGVSRHGEEARIATAGYRGIAKLTGLHPTTVKRALRSLVQKLSIEVTRREDSRTSTGSTYRVYSYKAILQRRNAQGLTWVLRTRGVKLLTPADVERHTAIPDLRAHTPDSPTHTASESVQLPGSHGPTGPICDSHTAPEVESHTGPVSETHTQSGKTQECQRISAGSSATIPYWTENNFDEARRLLVEHRGGDQPLPDMMVTKKIVMNFVSLAELRTWLQDLAGRMSPELIRNWGFYAKVAQLDAEAQRETAEKEARTLASHVAECRGIRFFENRNLHDRKVVLDGAPCSEERCPKGARLRKLVEDEGDGALENSLRTEARKRGPEWITYRELSKLRGVEIERKRINESCGGHVVFEDNNCP